MLIAKTKEESDLYIEQEISHILRNEYPVVISESENYRIIITKENEEAYQSILKKTIKSKDNKTSYNTYDDGTRFIKINSYGVLPVFDSVDEFIHSKYNRYVILVVCSSYSEIQARRGAMKAVTLEDSLLSLEFKEREFGSSGNVYRNNIEGMIKNNGYMIVGERNNNSLNGIQILEYKQINKK